MSSFLFCPFPSFNLSHTQTPPPFASFSQAEIFGVHLGCPNIDDMACMQSKTTKEVLEAAGKSFVIPLDVGSAVQQWAPIIDGSKEFPLEPLQGFRQGKLVSPPVPFMIGSNMNDGALFSWAIPDGKPLPTWEYVAIVVGIVHDDYISAVLDMYPANDTDNRPVLSHLLTDYFFACPSRAAMRFAQNAQSGNFESTYLYQFTRIPPFCVWPKHQHYCCSMCCHGDEIPYWGHDSGPPFPWNFTGTDQDLSFAMARYWANFAESGDPNTGSAPGPASHWPVYRGTSDINMNLDWPLKTETGLKNKQCKLWDEIGYNHATRHTSLDAHSLLQKARADPAFSARVEKALLGAGKAQR
jgi:carboxylesterase type B